MVWAWPPAALTPLESDDEELDEFVESDEDEFDVSVDAASSDVVEDDAPDDWADVDDDVCASWVDEVVPVVVDSVAAATVVLACWAARSS